MEFNDYLAFGEEPPAPPTPPAVELAEGELFDPHFDGSADPYATADGEEMDAVKRGHAEVEQKSCEQPAAERIGDLFGKMGSDRKALLAILRRCVKPAVEDEVASAVQEATAGKRSVYDPATLCRLLHRAGALTKVGADGEPFDEVSLEPRQVTVDGVTYLEPAQPQVLHWLATPEGIAAAEADEPIARVTGLFETKAELLPIFKRVLTMCATDGGASTKSINAVVDSDPLVQNPRYFASYFTEQLEKCDCIAWQDKAWRTTDTGCEALAMLDGIQDDDEADEAAVVEG